MVTVLGYVEVHVTAPPPIWSLQIWHMHRFYAILQEKILLLKIVFLINLRKA